MTKSVRKCKLTGGGHFSGHLGYGTMPIFALGGEVDKCNPYMKFGAIE